MLSEEGSSAADVAKGDDEEEVDEEYYSSEFERSLDISRDSGGVGGGAMGVVSTSDDDAPPAVTRHPQRTAAVSSANSAAGRRQSAAAAEKKKRESAYAAAARGGGSGRGWEEKPLSTWTAGEVAVWLEDAMRLPEAAALARSTGVGGLLLGVMTEAELQVELGVGSAFGRKKLLVHLDTLRALDVSYPSASAPARPAGYMGVGSGLGVAAAAAPAAVVQDSIRLPSVDAAQVEIEAHRTMEGATASWLGAELARIRTTATATRAASRLLLSTLEQKKEVVHTTLESTQRDIAKKREPINKVRHHWCFGFILLLCSSIVASFVSLRQQQCSVILLLCAMADSNLPGDGVCAH